MTNSDTETSLAKLPHAADLNRAVMLAIESAESREAKAEIRAHIDDFIRMAKGWRDTLDAEFGPQLEAEGEIVIGTTRYYHGYTNKVKANDDTAVLHALLEAGGGDESTVIKCLSAGCWKHGTVKTTLCELCEDALGMATYNSLFTTEKVLDVKTGAPKKGIKAVDTRFID